MNKNEFVEFSEAWAISQELGMGGKTYGKAAIVEMFEMLESFPLADVKSALRQHRLNEKFAPTLHDIVSILKPKGKSLHLSADEAWAIALRSMDEDDTVIVTKEMLKARTAAWDIYASGDQVGARMAFRAAYEREIEDAGEPAWIVSEGFDKKRRLEAVQKAVQQGLLPKDSENKCLLENGIQLDGLLALAYKKEETEDGKDKILDSLKKIKSMIGGE